MIKKGSVKQIKSKEDVKALFAKYPALFEQIDEEIGCTTKEAIISEKFLGLCGDYTKGKNSYVQHCEPEVIGVKSQDLVLINNTGEYTSLEFKHQNIGSIIHYVGQYFGPDKIKKIIIVSKYTWHKGDADGNHIGDDFSVIICEITDDASRKLIREFTIWFYPSYNKALLVNPWGFERI